MIINLGDLNEEQKKETCWNKKSLSGSRFKKWVLDWKNYDKEEQFSGFVLKKMEIGNKIEEFIRELIKEELKENFEVEKIKDTFVREDFDFCFANIDGMLIDKESGEKLILEIKNTETKDINLLFDRYKYQLLYYAWFFGVKKVCLAGFVNGWDLKFHFYEFDEQDLSFVETKILEFKEFINNGKEPTEIVFEIKNETEDENVNKSFEFINDNYENINLLNNDLKKHKEIILNFLNNEENLSKFYVYKNFQYNISKRKGAKSLDKDKIEEYLKNNNEVLEDFMKTAKDTFSLNIKKIEE